MGSRWVGLGRYSARIDPTRSGKPMGALPDPKTAIQNEKMQKLIENFKNLEFPIFPGESSLFFRVGSPGRSPIK